MLGADRRSALVMNGEIYNFLELRRELEQLGHRFRTHADSEVLLAALTEWKLAALDRLNGMFAFAWYDGASGALTLVRDHAGIKPLYYAVHAASGAVAFASRLDALFDAPWGRPGALRGDALHLYLRLHHLPAPYTLYEDARQLEPGHALTIHADGRHETLEWWRLPPEPQPDLRGDAALDALAAALERAVRRHRIADVPLGVFLSGGVDSPLVSAIARDQAGDQLEAFTIANPGWAQDEGLDAERYARALRLRQVRHDAIAEETEAAVDDVREAQYEPFADFSIIPTLMVSRLAREHVTVALSGDGGDELFFGYERPVSLLGAARQFGWPYPVRALRYAAQRSLSATRPSDVPMHRTAGDYYFAVNSRLRAEDLAGIAPALRDLPDDFGVYDSGPYRGALALANFSRSAEFHGQLQRGLKKVDMASMHHSLEVRVPLLDREVIDVSVRIDPLDALTRGERKPWLRALLARHVPAEIIPAPKRGFAVPLAQWLRGPLRATAEAALTSPALLGVGCFDGAAIRAYWRRHLSGEIDAKWGIWTLMTLSWWMERTG
jgi:asparagine synthase (glutamine-hydrolysing)